MFENLADYNFTFYYCDMRKRNHYRIPKAKFIENKEAFKELLGDRRFDILKLHTEDELSYKAIADIYEISITRISQIIEHSYYLIRKEGYEVEERLK